MIPNVAAVLAVWLLRRYRVAEVAPWGRLVALLLWVPLIVAGTAALAGGHVWGLVAWLGVPLTSAELSIALIAVPLGFVRVAWALDRFLGGTSARFEARTHAALPAARALLRRPSEAGARFVERYLSTCVELAGHGAAATALAALARGDRNRARAIFMAVESSAKGVVPSSVARLAREELALDGAARGDWSWVRTLGEKGKAGRLLRLLAALARYALAEPGQRRRVHIWLAWAVAPRRRLTWALVKHALALPPPAPSASAAPSLVAHAALAGRVPGRVRPADLAAAVESIDQLRVSTTVLAVLQRRSLALGVSTNTELVVDQFVRDAESDIARVVTGERLPVAWVPKGRTSESVRALVRDERAGRLEAIAAEFERRVRQRVDLPEGDEWCAWSEARIVCDELLRDAEDEHERRRIFEQIYPRFTAYAVRLINVRAARVLARDICIYLRDLAHATGSAEAYAIVNRNAAACLSDRLPRSVSLDDRNISNRSRTIAVRSGAYVLAILGLAIGLFCAFFAVRLVVPCAVAVVGGFVLRRRATDGVEVDDGIAFQSLAGRFIARRDDVTAVRCWPGAILLVTLRRAPLWLPRHLLLCMATREEARQAAARMQETVAP